VFRLFNFGRNAAAVAEMLNIVPLVPMSPSPLAGAPRSTTQSKTS